MTTAVLPARIASRTARTSAPARPPVPFADRPRPFADYTKAEWVNYQAYLAALPACPGYQCVRRILREADALRKLIAATLEEHGPDDDGTLACFLDEFGGTEVWDELVAMKVVLCGVAAAIDSAIVRV